MEIFFLTFNILKNGAYLRKIRVRKRGKYITELGRKEFNFLFFQNKYSSNPGQRRVLQQV